MQTHDADCRLYGRLRLRTQSDRRDELTDAGNTGTRAAATGRKSLLDCPRLSLSQRRYSVTRTGHWLAHRTHSPHGGHPVRGDGIFLTAVVIGRLVAFWSKVLTGELCRSFHTASLRPIWAHMPTSAQRALFHMHPSLSKAS